MSTKTLLLTKSYILAFAILLMWSGFAFFTMVSLIDSQKEFANLINISGKQRILSQRTALLGKRYFVDRKAKDMALLKENLALMQRDHLHIMQHLSSQAMQHVYIEQLHLNVDVPLYFDRVQKFIDSPTEENIHAVFLQSQELLPKLDMATSAFQEQSDLKTKELERREFFIFLGTVLTLVLEAFFIIRPAIRFINGYTETLETEVNKRTKDILIFANIFENSTEGMLITDADEKILNVNKAFMKITGYTKEEVLGKTPRILHSQIQENFFYEQMWLELHKHGMWQGAIVNKTKNAELIYENMTIIRLESDDGSVNYVSIFSDITQQIKDQAMLHEMATTDALTGLPNRIEILAIIEHASKLAQKLGRQLALIYIDVDNFKLINDAMNHSVGDMFLVAFTKRLFESMRETDTLSRLGGDEFVILVEDFGSEEDLITLIDKIQETIKHPFALNNEDFFVSASLGVVIGTLDEQTNTQESENAKTLLRKAELAMYSAKEGGKNRVNYYDATLDTKAKSKLFVGTQLRDAIANDHLEIFLQPKVELENRTITAAEALIRWKKDGMYIFPDQFIPIAEESSLITEIDFWVCKKSIEILKTLHIKGHTKFKLSLNISAKTFTNEESMQKYITLISQSSVAKFLDIEITENILVSNIVEASEMITKIKQSGATVSLDDFGTGYSSLSYLSRLPFDFIKIDRSFVMGMNDPKQKVLIDAILSFSKKLGMKIIAEGVETKEHLDWLSEHHCDEGQGYYFSKAVPVNEFEEMLGKRF